MKSLKNNLKISDYLTLSYFICAGVYKLVTQLLGKNIKISFVDILGVSACTFIISFIALLIINSNRETRVKNILEKYNKK